MNGTNGGFLDLLRRQGKIPPEFPNKPGAAAVPGRSDFDARADERRASLVRNDGKLGGAPRVRGPMATQRLG